MHKKNEISLLNRSNKKPTSIKTQSNSNPQTKKTEISRTRKKRKTRISRKLTKIQKAIEFEPSHSSGARQAAPLTAAIHLFIPCQARRAHHSNGPSISESFVTLHRLCPSLLRPDLSPRRELNPLSSPPRRALSFSSTPSVGGPAAVLETSQENRPAVDRLSEGGRAAVSKTRKSRRRRPRNSTAESKRKSMASSVDFRKDAQKNASQTSCSSAPLPSSSLTAVQCLTPSPLRPRSLYTTHTYHAQPDESNFQRYSEFAKYLEAPPPSEQWAGLAGSGFTGAGAPPPAAASLWRQPRNPKPIVAAPAQYYPPEEAGCIYTENWREHETEAGIGGAMATPHGTISLRLRNKIKVDMTIDRAVRVINFKNNIVLSLSGSGSAAALLHPNGRIYQYGSRVEILAHDAHGNNKYAKMWYKGVSFTSEQCALVYLVDAAGTRTTTDSFSDMSQDFSLNVFYAESRHGPACIQEAAAALSAAQYWLTDEGVENWIINNVRISQTPDGLVRIARNSNKYQLRTSPSNGTASLTTPFLHCTASLGQTSHLFVRRGERRMHYDGTSFIVRNAGHSAGFDDNNQLKVY